MSDKDKELARVAVVLGIVLVALEIASTVLEIVLKLVE